jgi:3-deoxy-D-manno-octulosonate 8-phosphate phosphatase (KDO 8-P phosphatase)
MTPESSSQIQPPAVIGGVCRGAVERLSYDDGRCFLRLGSPTPLEGASPPALLLEGEACRAAERAQERDLLVEVAWFGAIGHAHAVRVTTLPRASATPDPRLRRRLDAVRIVLLDVDGVLSSPTRTYTVEGLTALGFDVRDGHGIACLHAAGIRTALVSHCPSAVVTARARDLGIADVLLEVEEKGRAVAEVLARHGLAKQHALFVGDDTRDLPAFREVGVAVAVADAVSAVRAAADWVTERLGGAGAVREVTDVLLDGRADCAPPNGVPLHASAAAAGAGVRSTGRRHVAD